MVVIVDLTLAHFRTYSQKSLAFSSETTVIVGPNAIGKTNLLEAVYLLATGKSFRAEREEEVISYGEEMARVQAKVKKGKKGVPLLEQGDPLIELEVVLTRGTVQGERAQRKKFLVDGVGKRTVDFVGNLRAVLFWPQDIEIVTGSPSKRRTYLDFVLTQIDREYHRALTSYEHGLRQRNRLLKLIRESEATRNQLLYWDSVLITSGTYLTQKRREFIHFINDEKRAINSSVMEIVYDKSVISEERLKQYKDEEVQAATTLVGPHRDDFIVNIKTQNARLLSHTKHCGQAKRKTEEEKLLGERNLHSFGSRGEQRLAVLWLKLAEVDYIEKVTAERPILLLDDIFSELDHEHRGLVMEVIPKQQTIITTTDEHLIEKKDNVYEYIRLGQ